MLGVDEESATDKQISQRIPYRTLRVQKRFFIAYVVSFEKQADGYRRLRSSTGWQFRQRAAQAEVNYSV